MVEAVRTPIGRAHAERGAFRDTHPNALLSGLLTALIERTGIDPAAVEDVIAGCTAPFGEAVAQHRPQRLAAGGLPGRGPGDHDRPPLRIGAVGGRLRGRAVASGCSTTW